MARIGIVSYLNAAPLHARIDRARHDLRADHPATVARWLRDGAVDLALVPVGAVLADGEDLRVAPGWCIGADGPVASVLIVSETPVGAWRRVLLDGVSRTSALLARVLLSGPLAPHLRPDLEVVDVAPGTAASTARGEVAALVIGDAARCLPDRFVHRVDLALAWRQWTGLPFVFAVWAGRPDVAPELLAEVRRAGAAGTAAIPETYSGSDRVYLTEHIRYPLDDRALMGLRRFAAELRRRGLAQAESVQLFPAEADRLPRVVVDAALERAALGEALSATEAEAVATHARLADVAVAADLRRTALFGDTPAVAVEPSGVAVLTVGDGSSVGERVRTLLAWRQAPPTAMRVVAAEVAGPVGSVDNTAADQLRWQALARLLGPPVPLLAAARSEGVGMAQLGLRMGVDTWGEPVVDAAEVAHLVRDAARAAGPA
jgi:predicted solute-binding protein